MVEKRPKIGLALGGGGLRGMAHIGVLKALRKNGIKPDLISGTSAGSIIAALYACGVSVEQMEKVALSLRKKDILDWNFGLLGILQWVLRLTLLPFPWTPFRWPIGFVKGAKLETLIKRLVDNKTFSRVRMPLAIVASDINTGERVVFTNAKLATTSGVNRVVLINKALVSSAVRASISIPGVFTPARLEQRVLVDGGLTDNVPVEILQVMGADVIFAVNLGYMNPEKKVDDVIDIALRSLDIMVGETSDVEENQYADLIINPPLADIHLTDVHLIPYCIRVGEETANQLMPQIKKILADAPVKSR